MSRAKSQDLPGALEDYTEVIDTPDVPADLKAMALFNRALVHAAQSRNSSAIGDLEKLLAMPSATETVKTEARRKLVRMKRAAARDESHTSSKSAPSSSTDGRAEK